MAKKKSSASAKKVKKKSKKKLAPQKQRGSAANRKTKLLRLEKEAAKLYIDGKRSPAIKKLEDAMECEIHWYHYFYKAIWLFNAGQTSESAKAISDGLNHDKSAQFCFEYLAAELLHLQGRDPQKAAKNVDESVAILDQALLALDRAEHAMFSNKYIMIQIANVPLVLSRACPTVLKREDLTTVILGLRTKIREDRQGLLVYKMNMQTEARINRTVEENRQSIKSERLRTIELLGVFTAILALIFSAVMTSTKLPLVEAIVLQGGVALMLTTFFLGVHLVIFPERRNKLLLIIFAVLIVILLLLPFYAKWISL